MKKEKCNVCGQIKNVDGLCSCYTPAGTQQFRQNTGAEVPKQNYGENQNEF